MAAVGSSVSVFNPTLALVHFTAHGRLSITRSNLVSVGCQNTYRAKSVTYLKRELSRLNRRRMFSGVSRSTGSSSSGGNPDDLKPSDKEEVPFGYTRKDVLLIGLGVTLAGIGLKSGLEFAGVDPLQAGNVVQLFIVLGLTVGWISTYMFRVANKDMTYAQQLRDYEKKVMEKRLEGLTEAELEALLEQVEEEKRRLASGSDKRENNKEAKGERATKPRSRSKRRRERCEQEEPRPPEFCEDCCISTRSLRSLTLLLVVTASSVLFAMERHSNCTPSSSENGVLDVKPLRSLAPMFPAPFGFNAITQSTVPPFVCVTPFGSSPAGSDSSYLSGVPPAFPPFSFHEAPNQKPSNPDPVSFATRVVDAHVAMTPGANGSLRASPFSTSAKTPTSGAFWTPPATNVSIDEDGDPSLDDNMPASGRKTKRAGRRSSNQAGNSGTDVKRKRPNKSLNTELPLLPSSSNHPRESVEIVLMTYDALRRRLLQLDEAKDVNRRQDLKAGAIMSGKDLKANAGKRIGPVPGVEIGDIFYFRFEMCLIGLHAPSMAGIDYMTASFSDKDEPVAICIVSAGGYENEDDDVDVLIYSGQGGSGKHDKKQPDDQKLERGNLALERSLHRKNQIRVVRSTKDVSCPTGKIYIYDGLYKIDDSWVEKGKTGFNIFKYKLLREPGQPDGIAVWKMIQKWKENPSSRGRVILPDISSGAENIPVCLINDVDDERGPNHFVYVTTVKHLSHTISKKPLEGCMCLSVCLPGDTNCFCAQQNDGDLPYNSMGLLVRRKPLIYECSVSCQCSFNCRNRVTQKGIRLHFEVFRTKDRGWGLRSWDPIRAGTFICEYAGEVISKTRVEDDGEEDEYIFQATYLGEKASRWNCGPELLEDPDINSSNEVFRPFPITISAKNSGNIARFMNHSCSPNVFWQPVLYDHGDEDYPHIMFFAIKHIPPMTELAFDYGLHGDEAGQQKIGTGFISQRAKKCLCGSPNCRGYFG
ncbi:hypothetical protein C4D60_Mb08t24330 [Musa balbisiana]|uniref:Histone-lysine N-methyltransferase n=1 Tax=Musa balbisiana TaxID=52838 RepID=A0A4S8K649_MUSBA|nr:hypothetical protein C4D60_Mb08t24330 [Musa balbisiana]